MADDTKELADGAKWLMENPVFKHAVLKLRQQWFAEMMALEPQVGSQGYLTRLARHASMLAALESIPTELQVLVNNYKHDKKQNG